MDLLVSRWRCSQRLVVPGRCVVTAVVVVVVALDAAVVVDGCPSLPLQHRRLLPGG